MQSEGEPEEYPAGVYEIQDILRDSAEWHDGESEGYSYCLRDDDGNRGWECQTGVHFFLLHEDRRSEDFEWHPYKSAVPIEIPLQSRVIFKDKFLAWGSLADVGYRSRRVNLPGTYKVVDAGLVNTDEELPKDLPCEFVIYAIEDERARRIWVADDYLSHSAKA